MIPLEGAESLTFCCVKCGMEHGKSRSKTATKLALQPKSYDEALTESGLT